MRKLWSLLSDGHLLLLVIIICTFAAWAVFGIAYIVLGLVQMSQG